MCGIAAIIGHHANRQPIEKMLERIHHRGLDEHDLLSEEQVILGHKRRLKDATQPITHPSRKLSIICDGEIYNDHELRDRHLWDVEFETNSDNEIPLHLYEKYGRQTAHFLEGMFAFVIADTSGEKPEIYAARDPLGIKPLYYGETDGGLYFASELKCLFGMVEEIHEFPAGHYYTPKTGFVRYRTVTAPEEQERITVDADLSRVLENVRETLEKAVQKRLMADVPLGVLLSGGLDSSLIAGIAKKYRPGETLKSFSVGLEGSRDILAARDVAKHLGTEHYEYLYDEEELFEAVPEVIYYLESFEPSLVRSAIPNYFVARLAAKHVKVILSGEGADECFSGYTYLKDIHDPVLLNKELVRMLQSLHNINLQRLDRMTMAHSLEGRVPFLDEALIQYALKIPIEWKMRKQNGQHIEKWILRKAYEGTGLIPDRIVWRTKEEFSEGSGAKDVFEERLEREISDQELKREKKRILNEDQCEIRSKMELYFYRIFKQYFPHSSASKTVGRWATA